MEDLSLASPEKIALKYGGNKQKIADAIRMNVVHPTVGLMAGLFIDRMRNAAMDEQKQQTTLAQDTFGVQGSGTGTMAGTQLGMQGQQLRPPAPPQQQQPQQQPQPTQLAQASPGVEGLPAGDVGNYSMAGGGIVAFGDGGDVPGYAGTDGSVVGSVTDAQARALGFPDAQAYYIYQNTVGLPGVMRKGPTEANQISPVFVKPTAPANPNLNAFGLPRPDPTANLTLAAQEAKKLITVPTVKTPEQAFEAQEQMEKLAGVKNIYPEQKQLIEKDREQLKLDREEAKNMAILQAGLGIWGGESPYAAINIGKGAAPAIQTLASDLKDIKKAERELTRAEMAVDTAENNYKIDKSKSAYARIEKAEDRKADAEKTLASATTALNNSITSAKTAEFTTETQAASHLKGVEKQIAGQLEATGMNNRSAAHVAGIYTAGYQALEKLRQQGMPDAFKMANSPEMLSSMPGSTFKARLEAVAQATHPKDIKNALLNATSQVQKRADEEWANMSLINKDIKALKDKASKGDVDAQKELTKRKEAVFESKLQEFYAGYENLRVGAGGSEGDKLPRTSPPSMSEWMAAAKRVNPNASDEDLRAYYTQNYGR